MSPNEITNIQQLIDIVHGYSSNADIQLLMDAYFYAQQAHDGQYRNCGKDYITHPLAVAGILAEMKMDVETIATGLLHDTLEDDPFTKYELLVEKFGEDIAILIDGVTKIGKLKFKSKIEEETENFRKMVLAMAKDVRVVLVKLADRLHNMRNMGPMKPHKRKKKSEETMEIFVPIANRLGLSKVKSELEDLCFQYIEPELYAELKEKLDKRAPDHNDFIGRFGKLLQDELSSKGIDCQVFGRTKYLRSVYNKMVAQRVEFEQVHDLLAFRVLVDDLGSCYAGLGFIHALYPHHPNRLKDYIAQPKSNGYQSLHTVVLPEGRQVEIQFRTREMHRVAELGIAAHWRYKEGHLALSKEDIQKIAKLRALFEAAQELTDGQEFLDAVKVELFSQEVFVFTPAGDVRIFPVGATLLDFAYSIHTDLGSKCTGGIVDGRIVSLRYTLQNGDHIEILSSNTQKPNRDWLNIAKTSRALSKIRHSIRGEERDQTRELGMAVLERTLKQHDLSISKAQKSGKLDEVMKEFGHKTPEQLYMAIGEGALTVNKIVDKIIPPINRKPATLSSFFNRMRGKTTSPVLINGEDDVLTSFAKCCNPLPGEAVAGFITRGRGITIHKIDCPQYLASDDERKIPVQWQNSDTRHTATLEVACSNQMGILADLGATCKSMGINISHLETIVLSTEEASVQFSVAISHIDQINVLVKNVQKIKGVTRVRRV